MVPPTSHNHLTFFLTLTTLLPSISAIAYAMTFELFSRRLAMGLLDDGLTKILGPPKKA